MSSHESRVDEFHRLHASGCFVMPNPWDVGSARVLEQLGFEALATTSAGLAWSLGRGDAQVTLDAVLEHLRLVADAVDVPVNADFRDGYAVEPEGVAANVTMAVGTGIAGLSIEDSSGDDADPLLDFDLSVRRMVAARRAIDQSGTNVLLTGRSEGFVYGRPDIDETIRRLVGVRRGRSGLPLRTPHRQPRPRVGDRGRGVAEAGEPTDQRSVHHGRGGGTAGGAADQRGRHTRPNRLGRVPQGRWGDRRGRNVFPVPGAPRCRSTARLTAAPPNWMKQARAPSVILGY